VVSGRAPTKAAYLRLEHEPGLEFEFYLAAKVFHCSVAEMRERVGTDEFLLWAMYFSRIAQRRELEELKAKR
jgi:hypothetical protein